MTTFESDGCHLRGSAALDDEGNATAVWDHSYGPNDFSIESARRPVGGQWSNSREIVSQRFTSQPYAESASDAAGNVTVMWAKDRITVATQPSP